MNGRKNRMVSIRISSEEYELYRRASLDSGLQSLSELARLAMRHLIGEEKGKVTVEDQLRELRETVQSLSREVHRIAQTLDQKTGETTAERALGSTV